MKKASLTVVICVVSFFACSLSALGQPPQQYQGGPVLRNFKIYPLYYGKWSNADIATQQTYLNGLAGYLSGNNKPAGEQATCKTTLPRLCPRSARSNAERACASGKAASTIGRSSPASIRRAISISCERLGSTSAPLE